MAARKCHCGLTIGDETNDCAARCRGIKAEIRAAKAAVRARKQIAVDERRLPTRREVVAAEKRVVPDRYRDSTSPYLSRLRRKAR
jgi:hypothetical protein